MPALQGLCENTLQYLCLMYSLFLFLLIALTLFLLISYCEMRFCLVSMSMEFGLVLYKCVVYFRHGFVWFCGF